MKKLTRGQRNIKWIEEYCYVPVGVGAGSLVKLRPWQKKEILKIYDNPAGTRQAILSFPRKNGKTALISFLLLLHLCGPEAVINTELYSSAQSKDQAATVFKLARQIIALSPDLNSVLDVRFTAKEILCPDLGTFFAALSAESSTAHGKSPIFAIHDELGQVKGPTFEMYDTVETGMGAHISPLSIVISTQAPTDSALLSTLIDDAQMSRDKTTTISIYSAPDDADPFDIEVLKACNPAWGDFLNEKELIRTMEKAKALPSLEASYRNLHLNQRVEATAPFVSKAIWKANGDKPKPFGEAEVYGGLDLSDAGDLTALVWIGKVKEKYSVVPTFWLPSHELELRSRQDRVPYDVWHKQGHLQTTAGKSVDYSFVAEYLFKVWRSGEMNIKKIAFDRWGWRHFKPALIKAGFPEDLVEGDNSIFMEFGQGFASISPALRDLETDILNERLAHGNHPVLTMCMANSVVTTSPEGNRKLNKAKSNGRIDGSVALTMAKGAAGTFELTPETSTPWDDDPDYVMEL